VIAPSITNSLRSGLLFAPTTPGAMSLPARLLALCLMCLLLVLLKFLLLMNYFAALLAFNLFLLCHLTYLLFTC
jgi:hypothetical protein